MAAFEVEAYREDVDGLTESILATVVLHTETLAPVDRSIIVAAALANVACRVDAVQMKNGQVIIVEGGAMERLLCTVGAWKRG